MSRLILPSLLLLATAIGPAAAQVSQATVESLAAPASVDTRIGKLEFKNGVPSAATASTIFDTIDFTRALNVYNNSFRGASALAIKKGMQSVGPGSGDIVIFEELMDSSSPPSGLFTARRSSPTSG